MGAMRPPSGLSVYSVYWYVFFTLNLVFKVNGRFFTIGYRLSGLSGSQDALPADHVNGNIPAEFVHGFVTQPAKERRSGAKAGRVTFCVVGQGFGQVVAARPPPLGKKLCCG